MGNRDARYTLVNMIEMDEDYFTIESSELEKSKGKRGRGAAGKVPVSVIAESAQLEDIETGEKTSEYRYFIAMVLEAIFLMK